MIRSKRNSAALSRGFRLSERLVGVKASDGVSACWVGSVGARAYLGPRAPGDVVPGT